MGDLDELEAVYRFDGGQQIPTVRRVVEDVHLIQDADLSYPIILAADCGSWTAMHRVARALLKGRLTIAAVRFARHPYPDYRDCQPEDLPYD